MNDFVKAKADEFAKQGYVALAPDLYRGKVATDPDVAHQLMRGLPEDRAMRDLQARRRLPEVAPGRGHEQIGSIGWCMGGGYSLALALAEPLAGSVLYYGRLVTDDAKIAALKTPLLGNFGGQDQGIPPRLRQGVRAQGEGRRQEVDFKIYPDAGHGFASAPATRRPTVPADAKDADARADAFLAKVLGGK